MREQETTQHKHTVMQLELGNKNSILFIIIVVIILEHIFPFYQAIQKHSETQIFRDSTLNLTHMRILKHTNKLQSDTKAQHQKQ